MRISELQAGFEQLANVFNFGVPGPLQVMTFDVLQSFRLQTTSKQLSGGTKGFSVSKDPKPA